MSELNQIRGHQLESGCSVYVQYMGKAPSTSVVESMDWACKWETHFYYGMFLPFILSIDYYLAHCLLYSFSLFQELHDWGIELLSDGLTGTTLRVSHTKECLEFFR